MNDFWKKIKKKITTLSSQPQKDVNGSWTVGGCIGGGVGVGGAGCVRAGGL